MTAFESVVLDTLRALVATQCSNDEHLYPAELNVLLICEKRIAALIEIDSFVY